MLLGADEAHMRLMVVYAGLRVLDPEMIIEPAELKGVEIQELADLIKACYREASGRNGEIAFLARRDLGMNSWRVVRWWRRLTRKARTKKWLASYGDRMNRSQSLDTKEEKNDTV